MSVEDGELRAVIGPNGAGKTTFFNLISGFLAPTSGRILFDQQNITHLLPARRVWRGIARTFQVTEIFPEPDGARQSAHRGRGSGGLSAAAMRSLARPPPQISARVTDFSDKGGSPTRRTARSASSATATSGPPRS